MVLLGTSHSAPAIKFQSHGLLGSTGRIELSSRQIGPRSRREYACWTCGVRATSKQSKLSHAACECETILYRSIAKVRLKASRNNDLRMDGKSAYAAREASHNAIVPIILAVLRHCPSASRKRLGDFYQKDSL